LHCKVFVYFTISCVYCFRSSKKITLIKFFNSVLFYVSKKICINDKRNRSKRISRNVNFRSPRKLSHRTSIFLLSSSARRFPVSVALGSLFRYHLNTNMDIYCIFWSSPLCQRNSASACKKLVLPGVQKLDFGLAGRPVEM